jgi:hypothetical protein
MIVVVAHDRYVFCAFSDKQYLHVLLIFQHLQNLIRFLLSHPNFQLPQFSLHVLIPLGDEWLHLEQKLR